MVIDRSLYLDDINVLVKAYLRRGLAYEHMEKYKPAVNDLTRVRELQTDNKQALTAINRCLKYIEQDEGIKYQPNIIDMEKLPVFEGIKTADEMLQEELAKKRPTATPADTPVASPHRVEPVVKAEPTPAPKVQEKPAPPKEDKTLKELDDKLTVLKERGNMHYKKQAFKEAVKCFSEGINMFESAGSPLHSEDIKTKVTQLYTNRSLAFHNLDLQSSALSDASFVINKLDPVNQKALFRRAHALKTQGKFEDAVRDLQLLYKEQPEAHIKKELENCLKQFTDQRKA